jgi:outer membrane protein assembly factor BamD (BamD/ComL family)
MDKNPNQTDLYNLGYANYQAGNYDTAINLFCNEYQTKYPNEIFGYLWCARSQEAKDTSKLSDEAAAAYEKLAQMSLTIDSTKYKGQAKNARFQTGNLL